MKTIIAANAPWPDTKAKRPARDRIRRPRAPTYSKTQPVSEIDYLREAREQLAEMKRKKNANLAISNTSTATSQA